MQDFIIPKAIFAIHHSDIDLLVELERPARISLIDLIEIKDSLSELLGVKVDIAIKRNLRKRIGQRIQAEVMPL